MLINATQEEELRVAIVDGQKLYDLDIEVDSSQQKKANIYKGKITRIEPSLDAAFVEYGSDRHGFLPLKDISREYFVNEPEQGSRINIKHVLKEGQDIVVQVDKDERGNKGAALTTFISLPGRFIVLMPNNPRGGGVSRRISGEEREEIQRVTRELDVPEGMSCIVRTAGIGRTIDELSWDLEYLKGIWQSIMQVVLDKPSPFLIYQDSSPVVRALRDHFSSEIGEITIDDNATYEEAKAFMEHAMPHNLRKLKLYTDEVPLFTRFQIESQIESAYSHTVNLPSGGSIVIDHTEALVSIDINSARATKGGDIEATALATNLEAADEIARQCRLRDLGGLLVIDFIDMNPNRNQREVENRFKDAVRTDRARVQIGRISRFGLLEMSRQRLRRSLGESAHQVCPRCSGSGSVRSVESLALAILRLLAEETRKERTTKVISELPVDVATFLLNEKREWIQNIESRTGVQILLIANPDLETPNYSLRRVRDDQVLEPENSGASYKLSTPKDDLLEDALKMSSKSEAERPAVTTVVPATPAPAPKPSAQTTPKVKSSGGLFGFIKRLFVGTPEVKTEQPTRNRRSNRSGSGRNQNNRNRNRNRNSRDTRGRQNDRNRKSGGRDGNSNNGGRKQSNPGKSIRNQSRKQDQDQQKTTNQDSQTKQTQQGDGVATPRRRRRKRRSKNNREQGQSHNTQAVDVPDVDGNKAETKPADNNSQRPERAKQSSLDKVADKPASKSLEQQPVVKPTKPAAEKSAPKENVAKLDKAPSQKDNDRLLPWETSVPKKQDKTYKVWSSDNETDQ
ncbi:MAG: Rne/Rng family ribonuclease [Gammaproteobacteria bacterium]|nr:Rne/Rng family ribonuclease [Gammaproteobacteria bacterium]MCP4088766.1 Rne/Rng family ribonuclease [Gammaproteobacteria bacterium]MCP4275935.1 Rne/Rng family ribonuclease [Gammaproteobacteria bacterium]MCP4832151.1 Rne/Rng family ribonuclease [Gammaproteobacteria bacterium]MCP4928248.1 Rne/Rng family ribonuclease [Gammaproteobacteria bacterium]